jgi:2',3'-cyclic-nucleotide 2'-phosphodiesterase (5'-nucleotidase family)
VTVDAGDSLAHAVPLPEEQRAGAEARARLVLAAMARARIAAVAVGERDLALGTDWLAREALAAGVPLLATNLRAADGTRPFAPHRIVEAGGARIGILAVTGASARPDGLTVDEPGEAAKAAAAALRAQGATLVVALLHMGRDEARALAVAGLPVDVAIVAHEGRRLEPEPVGSVLLAAPSDRGRDLFGLTLDLSSRGRWADLGAPRRAEEERQAIERWIAIGKDRLTRATAPADRKAIEDFLSIQAERLGDAGRRSRLTPEGRLFEARTLPLGPEAPEDPALAAEVEKVTARYGAPPGAEE